MKRDMSRKERERLEDGKQFQHEEGVWVSYCSNTNTTVPGKLYQVRYTYSRVMFFVCTNYVVCNDPSFYKKIRSLFSISIVSPHDDDAADQKMSIAISPKIIVKRTQKVIILCLNPSMQIEHKKSNRSILNI